MTEPMLDDNVRPEFIRRRGGVRRCPKCGVENEMMYDNFEDTYRCPRVACGAFLYPEELGLVENPEAGIWKVGAAQ